MVRTRFSRLFEISEHEKRYEDVKRVIEIFRTKCSKLNEGEYISGSCPLKFDRLPDTWGISNMFAEEQTETSNSNFGPQI